MNDTKGWEGWLKDLAQSHNDEVRFYGDVMDAFSQEHPCLAAIAQGIGDVEGLHPTFFPETKGEALSTGLALITGKTRPMAPKMLSGSKPSRVQLINGRKPVNAEFANKVYPLERLPEELRRKYPHSVPFTGTGHPDFSRYAIKKVRIQMTGNTNLDFAIADKAAGLSKRPKDYTWHHHQDTQTMLLVPKDIHRVVSHTGGMAIFKSTK